MQQSPEGLRLVETADGSYTYFNPAFNQTYHSTHGALTESLTVFINGSHYAERLITNEPQMAEHPLCADCTVVEIGFGLGLNFVLTADQALTHNIELTYHALENALPDVALLRPLDYGRHLSNGKLWDGLIDCIDASSTATSATNHRQVSDRTLLQPATGIKLYLYPHIEQLQTMQNASASFVFLDGFSPDSNPECWTNAMLERCHKLLKPGGVLVTYSAKGQLRRQLQALGLSVEKCPGPPGKREFLRAHKVVRPARKSN